MKKYTLIIICMCILKTLSAQQPDSEPRHFVGSTMFMLFNLAPDPPSYYQLNYGYRLTPKNVFTTEAITWTYKGPIGRQYGPFFENPDYNFPGKVRAYGLGISYKRFLWKQAYAQIHSTPMIQLFKDKNNHTIQRGFQLFNTYRVGYQFRFWGNRFFIEPSIAITHWPIYTNLPAEFQVLEDQFPNYFLGEPGLHFGVNF